MTPAHPDVSGAQAGGGMSALHMLLTDYRLSIMAMNNMNTAAGVDAAAQGVVDAEASIVALYAEALEHRAEWARQHAELSATLARVEQLAADLEDDAHPHSLDAGYARQIRATLEQPK
jgi:hypothetical protein